MLHTPTVIKLAMATNNNGCNYIYINPPKKQYNVYTVSLYNKNAVCIYHKCHHCEIEIITSNLPLYSFKNVKLKVTYAFKGIQCMNIILGTGDRSSTNNFGSRPNTEPTCPFKHFGFHFGSVNFTETYFGQFGQDFSSKSYILDVTHLNKLPGNRRNIDS